MKQTVKWLKFASLILLITVFGIGFGQEEFVATTEWYQDYTYNLVLDNGNTSENYIEISEYKGKVAKSLYVPAEATIDGVVYRTKLVAVNESIWKSTKNKLTTLKFQNGCVVESGSFLFMDLSKLKTVNVEALDTSHMTDTAWMFANCSSITKLDVAKWNMSNVTNMFNMFGGCEKLKTLDVRKWDTSNVTVMTSVFDHCKSLTKINVENWDVSKVTCTEYMFYLCEKLKSLDLHKWKTSNITTMYEMFGRCYSITSINVKGWNTSKVTSMAGMFGCNYNLTSIDLSSFDMSKVKFGKYDDAMFLRNASLKTIKTPKKLKKKLELNIYLTYVKKTGSKLGTKEYTYIPKGSKSITLVCKQSQGKATSIKSITSTSGKLKLSWKSIASKNSFIPIQYEVQCSTNKNFTDSVGTLSNATDDTYSVQDKVTEKTSTTIKGLTKGKTYYVRVRTIAYGKRISKWSNVKKIKIK